MDHVFIKKKKHNNQDFQRKNMFKSASYYIKDTVITGNKVLDF